MSLVNITPPHEDYYEIVHTEYYTSTTSLSLVYTLNIPITGFLDLFVKPIYNNAAPTACAVSTDTDISHHYNILAEVKSNTYGTDSCSISGLYVTAGQKLYIFTSHGAANSNRVDICGLLRPFGGCY